MRAAVAEWAQLAPEQSYVDMYEDNPATDETVEIPNLPAELAAMTALEGSPAASASADSLATETHYWEGQIDQPVTTEMTEAQEMGGAYHRPRPLNLANSSASLLGCLTKILPDLLSHLSVFKLQREPRVN